MEMSWNFLVSQILGHFLIIFFQKCPGIVQDSRTFSRSLRTLCHTLSKYPWKKRSDVILNFEFQKVSIQSTKQDQRSTAPPLVSVIQLVNQGSLLVSQGSPWVPQGRLPETRQYCRINDTTTRIQRDHWVTAAVTMGGIWRPGYNI